MRACLAGLLITATLGCSGCSLPRADLWVRIAPDGTHFVCDGRAFRLWGFNYDRTIISGRDVLLRMFSANSRPS